MAYAGTWQPQQPEPQKRKEEETPDEFYEDGVCVCSSSSGFARLDNWCIFLVGVGGIMMMVSMFLPYWRRDPHGTTELQKYFDFKGFETKSYGIIHVKASWSQSWTTLAQATCDIRNFGQISGLASKALKLITGDGKCAGSESCQQGFSSNMHTRCLEYQTMMRISMVTMAGTFLGCILIMAGTLVTSMSKRKKSGGIAFGLYLFAGILCAVVNGVWAGASDNSFKNMAQTAWYPYPSLYIAFYLHTVGYAFVLIFNSVFGYLVLPGVWEYDPAQEKLDKKKAKLEKKLAKQHKYDAKKEELQAIMNGKPAAGNFPPPPGMVGPGAPPPRPYGQSQFPQPGQAYGQPQAYGQQAFGQPQAYGQQPAASQGGPPGAFGLPPAAQGGELQSQGFGLAPPGQGGPQGPSGGFNWPARQDPPPDASGGFNWPARQDPPPDAFPPAPVAPAGGFQPPPLAPLQQAAPPPQPPQPHGGFGGFSAGPTPGFQAQGPARGETWNQMPGPPPAGE